MNSGAITVSQLQGAVGEYGSNQSSISAAFNAGGPPDTGCFGGTQTGNCCVTPLNPASPPAVTPVSAGTIAVSDNGVALGVMKYSSDTQYPVLSSLSQSSLSWAAGDVLRLRASGATVGPFDGTVTVPPTLTGVTPAPATGAALALPVGADLVFSWTPAAGSQIRVSVTDFAVGAVSCTGDDAAGTLTIPAALVSSFNAGDTGAVVFNRIATGAPTTGPGNASVVYEVSNTLGESVTFGG